MPFGGGVLFVGVRGRVCLLCMRVCLCVCLFAYVCVLVVGELFFLECLLYISEVRYLYLFYGKDG